MAEDKVTSVVDLSSTGSELDKLFNQLQSVFNLIKQINQEGSKINLSKGVSEGTIAAQEAKAATEQLRLEREKLKQQEDAVKISIAQSRLEQQNANTETAQARAAIAALNLERAKSKPLIINEAGSLNDLKAKLTAARKEYDALGESARNASTGKNLEAVINNLNEQVSQIEEKTGRFQRNVGNYPTEILGGIGEALGAFGIATGALEIGKEVFDATREISSLNQGLLTVSKTAKEFAANQLYLSQTSDRLGLNVIDLTNSFKLFYAAATQSGLTATATRKIFEQVSGAAANLHLSQDDANGVLEAFSQILGKGKVQAEELRGQIGERLPGAFEVAAKSIGVTTQQLDKMLQKGQLNAVDFLPKFANALEDTFGPAKGQKVDSLNASVNRLSNSFTNLISDNESGLSKFFTTIIDLAGEVLQAFSEMAQGVVFAVQSISDPKGAQKLIESLSLKDLAKDYLNATSGALLEARNNVDKNIGFVENRIKGAESDIDIAKKQGTPSSATAAFLAQVQNQLDKDKAELELLNKNRDLLLGELNKRYAGSASSGDAQVQPLTQAQKDAAAKLAELRIKANADVAKAELEQQIEEQKRVLDNDKVGYASRLAANDKYIELKEQLNKLDTDAQKKEIQQQIAIGKAVPEQLAAIDAKSAQTTFKNATEGTNNLVKITKDGADQRTKTLMQSYETNQQNLIKQQDEETEKIQQYYAEGKITAEQFESEKLRIKNKYDILNVQDELDTQLQILDIMKQQGLDVVDEENKILALKNQLRELDLENTQNVEDAKTKAQQKSAKERADLAKQELDLTKQVAKESISAVFAIFDAQYENQKNQLQDQIDAIDKSSQKEIDAINASTDTEQSKADKIAIINARSQAQKDQLAARQRQVDEQKARFDRLKNIGDIVAQTAVNIVKVFPNPILIALAAAVGAAQLAQVLATPIAKYRLGAGVNGRPAHPGGMAYVNDGGKLEVIEPPTGPAFIPQGHNVLLNMEKGTKVHTSIEDYIKNTGAYHKKLPTMSVTAQTLHMSDELGRQYEKHTKALKESIDNGLTHVHVVNTFSGLIATKKRANQYQQFLDREIFF